jgi:4'-phosphopantetheinyl transferase
MHGQPGNLIELILNREGWKAKAAVAAVSTGDLEVLDASVSTFLSPSELQSYRAMEFPRRRQSFLLGRYAAKRALGVLGGGADPRVSEVRPGVFGQPIVRGAGDPNPGISITHSNRLALALAHPAGHPMAIDIEESSPDRVEAIRSQMSALEIGLIPVKRRNSAPDWTLLWTAREALSKVLVCGLTCPMAVLAVDSLVKDPIAGSWGGTFRNFAQYRFASWVVEPVVVSIVLPRKTELSPSGAIGNLISQVARDLGS